MDNMSPKPLVAKPPPDSGPESQSQLTAALAITAAITVICIALIIGGAISKQWAIVAGLIGTGLGALATALNAPTGIGKVLTAAKQPPQDGVTKETT